MGVGVSSFPDNDSLIDSIVKRNDFPPHIERVLRLVDRGDYTISPKTQIYSDSAWRVERLHLSAPGIYATVLRDLNIQPGQSVLNIGSGTGYLSTMFGLLLGSNGVNHGIELHSSNVQFARERLRHFMSTSDAIYECDFCPPQFTVGNIFSVVPPSPSSATSQNSEISEDSENILEQSMHDDPAQISQLSSPTIIDPPPPLHRNKTGAESDVQTWPTYDRIYVGAMISSINQLKAILRLLNVGGSLIAPIFDQLHKIDRVTETVLNDTVLNSVSFVNLVVPSSDEPEVLPLPKREVDRLEVLACRCLRRELRRVIIQRNGGHLPTLPRYVRRKRRRHRRPPLQPFTGPSPPSSPPGDNPPASTSRATLVSPQGSTPTAPSARISNSSSSSTSSSSPRQHRLPTKSGLENGIGGGEYDDTDELDGVRPFTSPNPPHRSSPPPPIRPPSEAPQLLAGILGGDTIDVNTAGSSSTTASEQMDFIEMISRNFLYCRMLARNRQRHQDRLPELSDEDNQIADEEEQNEEDTSYSNDSSTESSTGSYTSPCEDSDQTNSEEEEEDREEREDHGVAGEEGREHQGSDSPSRRQSVGHSSQRSRRNKRRRRGDTTEESTGHDSDNEHDSGTRKEVKRKVRSSQCRKKRHLVWRRQSYLFQEEMRRLLEEIRHAVDYSGYVGELVLKIN